MSATTDALVFPADVYVQHGVQYPGMGNQQWADTFKALGGLSCLVTMAWQHGMAAGAVVVTMAGSQRAIDFAVEGIALTVAQA